MTTRAARRSRNRGGGRGGGRGRGRGGGRGRARGRGRRPTPTPTPAGAAPASPVPTAAPAAAASPAPSATPKPRSGRRASASPAQAASATPAASPSGSPPPRRGRGHGGRRGLRRDGRPRGRGGNRRGRGGNGGGDYRGGWHHLPARLSILVGGADAAADGGGRARVPASKGSCAHPTRSRWTWRVGCRYSTCVLVSHTFQRHVGRYETAIGPNTCGLFNGHSGGGGPYSTKGRTLAGAHKMKKNESHPSSY